MTVESIIAAWLKNQPNHIISTPQIEQHLPAYGMQVFGRRHTPGTYARIFRKMRLNAEQTATKHGIVFAEHPLESKRWQITLN